MSTTINSASNFSHVEPLQPTSLLNHIGLARVDAMYRLNRKKSAAFHHTCEIKCNKAEMVVHTFDGTDDGSFAVLYVPGSWQHFAFFEAYRNAYCSLDIFETDVQRNQSITWFSRFEIDEVNRIVKTLREKPEEQCSKIQRIRNRLTQEELAALPEKFQVRQLPTDFAWMAIWDCRTIRSCTSSSKSDAPQVIRWKISYTLTDVSSDQGLPSWPRPSCARLYEERQVKRSSDLSSLWPRTIPILQRPPGTEADFEWLELGVALFPLNPRVLEPVIEQTEQYLRQIMQWTEDFPSMRLPWIHHADKTVPARFLFREPKLVQSKHIPSLHGRTMYGHHLPILADLFDSLKPTVATVLAVLWPQVETSYAITADIACQF